MNFLADTLTYPVRKSGKYILLIGAAISLLGNLASMAPLIGGIAGLIFSGYFCAVYFQIIQSSAIGDEEAPEFPEFSNVMDDLVWPIFQTLLVLAASFGPSLLYATYSREGGKEWISLALFAFGALYAPMSILAIAVLGHVGAMSPHIVFPSIFRVGWLYPVGVTLIVLLYGIKVWISHLLGVGVIPSLLMEVASTYCLMVNGRALGLIYRRREEELNWL